MKNKIISFALVAGLAACSGGNPFETDDDANTDTDTTTDTTDGGTTTEGTGINRDGVPPGTVSPSPNAGLFRSEAAGDTQGNGSAQGISYDGASDTFTVDNLAFDGDRPYTRGEPVGSLNEGEFAVYEGPATAIDPVSGEEVDQFIYRAVYGVSRNRVRDADGNPTGTPSTQFAIVRTGSYVDYGFGGFIYQRDDTVTLPDALQATFTGKSAGLRDFQGAANLQYTTADVTIDIDLEDFNDSANVRGDGVKGTISNRQVFDLAGEDVTASVAGAIGLTQIPDAVFAVGPNVLDSNGDLVGNIASPYVDADNKPANYEEGNYYAIVSGADPDEIVGVFVLQTTEDFEGSIGRDTSGFIVYRGAAATP